MGWDIILLLRHNEASINMCLYMMDNDSQWSQSSVNVMFQLEATWRYMSSGWFLLQSRRGAQVPATVQENIPKAVYHHFCSEGKFKWCESTMSVASSGFVVGSELFKYLEYVITDSSKDWDRFLSHFICRFCFDLYDRTDDWACVTKIFFLILGEDSWYWRTSGVLWMPEGRDLREELWKRLAPSCK